jgi:hypothetical protein
MQTDSLPRSRVRRSQILVVGLLLALSAWLVVAWQEQKRPARYHLIEDGLYLGEAVQQPPLGTQAVVNLCGAKDDYDVEYELHLPILEAGSSEPSLEWLEQVVTFIDEHRQAERTVYVHCQAGVNRSSTAVIAYLMHKYQWSRDDALRFVQKQRQQASPNLQLMHLLADWEKHLTTKYPDE